MALSLENEEQGFSPSLELSPSITAVTSGQSHTPGPWETSQHREPWTPKLWTIREHEFPNYPYEGQLEREWGVYPPLGESGPVALVAGEANARLIVAAPEMLKALKWARSCVPFPSDCHAAICAAIAKVEGQP